MLIRELQLGKRGITDNFINSVKREFNKADIVKISVLKSARREEIKSFSEEIVKKLKEDYGVRIIGFKIILRKRRGFKLRK